MIINGVRMMHTGVVSERTDIVIEGLYRCGNTFAVVAFQLAQQQPLELAHHLHAEAQIIKGVALNRPVILLLRNPEDVVTSSMSSFGVPVKQALKDYVTFYARMLPYRNDVIIADFETVTSNYGAVIKAVNTKFGTHFGVFQHTKENVDRCFEIIDEFYRRTAPEPGRTVARPSGQRHARKDSLHAQLFDAQFTALRREALQLYTTLSSNNAI
jgi:hypothetical protein